MKSFIQSMRTLFLLVVGLGIFVVADGARAIDCGKPYTIRAGDTLGSIAAEAYGTSQRWSLIFYSNRSALGENPSLIMAGTEITIPCMSDSMAASDSIAPTSGHADISLLTASDYRPFTDQSLPNGGMVTHIINAALQVTDNAPSHRIVWINDWSSHLNPLLAERQFDMGFPWLEPDECNPGDEGRCEFIFSDPVFEMLIVFFKNRDDDFVFSQDEDVHGKRVCRPSGYYTFDLDQRGRRWLADNLITLVQPPSVNDCFRMLSSGEVELVALNEFTGRAAISDLGMSQDVVALQNPISIQGLHAIVHRTHPRGTVLIHKINEGIRRLESQGALSDIVAEHLARFYEENS